MSYSTKYIALLLCVAVLLCSAVLPVSSSSYGTADRQRSTTGSGRNANNPLLRADTPEISDVNRDVLSLSAQASVLMDGNTGEVLYSENASSKLPMASTTKIMTALIALEHGNIDAEYTVPAAAVGIEGSSVYLVDGEKLTMKELVYALMLESANDAAEAIAILIAGSVPAFADMMNRRAAELGLSGTHFTNPHGLDDPEHYTTAYDLAKLSCYALNNEDFLTVVSTRKRNISFNSGEGIRLLVNHNRMLRSYDGAIGVKTGYTKKCGRCLVSAAERDGMRLVAVTLNAPDDWRDHTSMLDWGFASYVRLELAAKGSYKVSLAVCGGSQDSVICSNITQVALTLPASHGDISCTVEAPRFLIAPFSAGQQVGRLIYRCDGEIIACVPLCAETGAAVKQKHNFFIRWLMALFGREYQ